MHIYIYIYIHRERERERHRDILFSLFAYTPHPYSVGDIARTSTGAAILAVPDGCCASLTVGGGILGLRVIGPMKGPGPSDLALGLQGAQSRSDLHISGPKVGSFYVVT